MHIWTDGITLDLVGQWHRSTLSYTVCCLLNFTLWNVQSVNIAQDQAEMLRRSHDPKLYCLHTMSALFLFFFSLVASTWCSWWEKKATAFQCGADWAASISRVTSNNAPCLPPDRTPLLGWLAGFRPSFVGTVSSSKPDQYATIEVCLVTQDIAERPYWLSERLYIDTLCLSLALPSPSPPIYFIDSSFLESRSSGPV